MTITQNRQGLLIKALCFLVFSACGNSYAAEFELEVWVASGAQCNACDIWEGVKVHRGYEDTLQYTVENGNQAGETIAASVKEVDKADLSGDILAQLPAGEGPDSEYWPITVSVLVVDDDTVLAAGNIAQSADVASAQFSESAMNPPARPDEDHPALHPSADFPQFFTTNWNLEFFLERAFNPDTRDEQRPWFADAELIPYADKNVILWGSGANPQNNELYISERMHEIAARLDALSSKAVVPIYLYANGAEDTSRNKIYQVNGEDRFKNITFPNSLPASLPGLKRLFATIHHEKHAQTLLIQVGHSSPSGAPTFGYLKGLTKQEMETGARDRDLVMVSGACFGGQFADVGRCGFFGAHPEVIATGCQQSPEAIRHSDDYLRLFFRATETDHRTRADTNNDGMISFAEAHWYAVPRVEDHNLPYTTLDYLADRYFEQHPQSLPASVTVADIAALRTLATPAEKAALKELIKGLVQHKSVGISDVVATNKAINTALTEAGATEWTSTRRNEFIDLDYKLALAILAKRLLFKRAVSSESTSQLQQVQACAAQSITAYLE